VFSGVNELLYTILDLHDTFSISLNKVKGNKGIGRSFKFTALVRFSRLSLIYPNPASAIALSNLAFSTIELHHSPSLPTNSRKYSRSRASKYYSLSIRPFAIYSKAKARSAMLISCDKVYKFTLGVNSRALNNLKSLGS